MRLEFKVTFADFKAAFRLHRRQTIVRRLSGFIWPILTLACIAAALVSNPKSELFAQAFGIGVVCLWFSLAFPVVRVLSVRRSYRRFFPNSETDRECFAEVNDKTVVTGIVGAVELRYAWKAIIALAQDERTTLFYTSKCSFLFFPTPAMSPAQRTELNDLIARHVTKR